MFQGARLGLRTANAETHTKLSTKLFAKTLKCTTCSEIDIRKSEGVSTPIVSRRNRKQEERERKEAGFWACPVQTSFGTHKQSR